MSVFPFVNICYFPIAMERDRTNKVESQCFILSVESIFCQFQTVVGGGGGGGGEAKMK